MAADFLRPFSIRFSRGREMAEQRKAFSLVELVIIVLFVGILTAIAVPKLNFAVISKNKADTTARKLVTDLRRSRALAISDAAENDEGYQLKMTGAGFYTGYEIENRDTEATVDSHTFDSEVTVTCLGSPRFNFAPLGNIDGGSGTHIAVSGGGKTFTITITPATGMIKCTEN